MDNEELLLQDLISDSSESSNDNLLQQMPQGPLNPSSQLYPTRNNQNHFAETPITSKSVNNEWKDQIPWQDAQDDKIKNIQRIFQDEYVPFTIFKEVVKRLETRLQELEQRLENKENINHLNQQLTNLRSQNQLPQHSSNPQIQDNSLGLDDGSDLKNRSPMCLSGIQDTSVATEQKPQKSPMSQTRKKGNSYVARHQFKSIHQNKEKDSSAIYHSPPQMKQNLTPQREDSLISRLNLFEKKQKILEERFLKLNKEFEVLRRENEKKMELAIKRVHDEQEKTKQIRLDIMVRVEELGQNQKAFISHLHSIGQEINVNGSLFSTLKEEFDIQNREVTQKLTLFESVNSKSDEYIKDLRNAQNSIESDLFLILKNYKDMLTEVLKVQILGEDIKTLYQMIQDKE